MIPWVRLDSAQMPGGGGELRLMQRGGEFSIMAGAIELMNSRLFGSEEALATLCCERLCHVPAPRVLIGGLGMGFTLRAALGCLPSTAAVTVAELVPEVIAWARGPMAAVHGDSLDDPRLQIVEADVADVIAAVPARWDAILLDVDNGPEGLTRPANDSLYDAKGLGAARGALRSGGVLAVWSSAQHPAFTQRLQRSGFSVDERKVRAGRGRGARHAIWLAMRP